MHVSGRAAAKKTAFTAGFRGDERTWSHCSGVGYINDGDGSNCSPFQTDQDFPSQTRNWS